MEHWQESETRPGYRSKTLQHGACKIIINRPVLDDKERAKREQRVQETLGRELHNYITKKQAGPVSA